MDEGEQTFEEHDVRLGLGGGQALDTTGYATANNGACTITITPQAGRVVQLRHIMAGYDGTPTGGLLTVSSTRGTLRRVPITAGGPAPIPLPPWEGLPSEAIVVTLAAGGSGVSGYLNVDAGLR